MNVPEQTLVNELNKILRKRFAKKLQEESDLETMDVPVLEIPSERQVEFDIQSSVTQEKEVIRLLLLYGNADIIFQMENEDKELEDVAVRIADFITGDILNDEIRFENKVCQKIFDEIAQNRENGIDVDKDHFLHHPDMEVSALSIDMSITPYELSENWEKNRIFVNHEREKLKDSVISAVLAFKAKKIEKMMEEIQKKLKEPASEEDLLLLMEQLLKLKSASIEINDQLGRIIIR
jgi:DNA primase